MFAESVFGTANDPKVWLEVLDALLPELDDEREDFSVVDPRFPLGPLTRQLTVKDSPERTSDGRFRNDTPTLSLPASNVSSDSSTELSDSWPITGSTAGKEG